MISDSGVQVLHNPHSRSNDYFRMNIVRLISGQLSSLMLLPAEFSSLSCNGVALSFKIISV